MHKRVPPRGWGASYRYSNSVAIIMEKCSVCRYMYSDVPLHRYQCAKEYSLVCTHCLCRSLTDRKEPRCPHSPRAGRIDCGVQNTWEDVDEDSRAWKRFRIDDQHAVVSACHHDRVEAWLRIHNDGYVERVFRGGIEVFDKLRPERRTRDVYVALVASTGDVHGAREALARVPPG